MAGNNAVYHNRVVGPQADLGISNRGSSWLFAVCAMMGAATIAFFVLAMHKKPHSHRLFYYIAGAITAITTVSYFAMGSGLGQVPIEAEFLRPGNSKVFLAGTREIFYARWIDRALTWPLLILALTLVAGFSTPTILITMFAGLFTVVCWLIGALTQTSYKWGFFVFGLLSLFYVIFNLVIHGRRHATALGPAPGKTFTMAAGLFVLTLLLHPIAWGLSEGGNVIHPDSESIFYGILDLLSKPVLLGLLLWSLRKILPTHLGRNFHEPTTLANGAVDKPMHGTHNGTHSNGTQQVV